MVRIDGDPPISYAYMADDEPEEGRMISQPNLALLGADATDDQIDAFVESLLADGEARKYNPNQPRKPDGKWGSGGISPTYGADMKPAKGGLLTDDPTRLENLPPELRAEMEAKVDAVFGAGTVAGLDGNIEATLDRAIADSPDLVAEGKVWYGGMAHDAAAEIADRDGITLEQSVGGVAAMSPQQEWGSNLATADYVSRKIAEDPVVKLDDATMAVVISECSTERYAKNRSDPTADLVAGEKRLSEYPTRVQAQIVKAMGMSEGVSYVDDVTGTRTGCRWTCGADGVEKAVRIYRGESPDAVLSGHKVRSFNNNILGGSNSGGSLTVDTHAVSLSVGRKISAKDIGKSGVLSAPSSRAHGVKGAYAVFADAYRRVAAKRGLSPEQVQAITWLQWRREHP